MKNQMTGSARGNEVFKYCMLVLAPLPCAILGVIGQVAPRR